MRDFEVIYSLNSKQPKKVTVSVADNQNEVDAINAAIKQTGISFENVISISESRDGKGDDLTFYTFTKNMEAKFTHDNSRLLSAHMQMSQALFNMLSSGMRAQFLSSDVAKELTA